VREVEKKSVSQSDGFEYCVLGERKGFMWDDKSLGCSDPFQSLARKGKGETLL
jgi:hypothetical protein